MRMFFLASARTWRVSSMMNACLAPESILIFARTSRTHLDMYRLSFPGTRNFRESAGRFSVATAAVLLRLCPASRSKLFLLAKYTHQPALLSRTRAARRKRMMTLARKSRCRKCLCCSTSPRPALVPGRMLSLISPLTSRLPSLCKLRITP